MALTFEFAILNLVNEVHSLVKVVQLICGASNPLYEEVEEQVSTLRVQKNQLERELATMREFFGR